MRESDDIHTLSSYCNDEVESVECHLHALMCSVSVVTVTVAIGKTRNPEFRPEFRMSKFV